MFIELHDDSDLKVKIQTYRKTTGQNIFALVKTEFFDEPVLEIENRKEEEINLKELEDICKDRNWKCILRGHENNETVIDFTNTTVKYNVVLGVEPEGYGTVSGGGEYEKETEVTVTASPEAGKKLKHWTEDGSPVSTDSEYVFEIISDRNLVAVFEDEE